jgi:single-strand DNA-binding protein
MGDGVNKAILVGNLGKDPELSYTQSGIARCKFPLATTETYSGQNSDERQERTEWHNIVVWRKTAETSAKYLKKGRQVYIEGRISTRSWDDNSGNKRYITEIHADKVLFIGSSGRQETSAAGPVAGPTTTDDSSGGMMGSFGQDDDIPF